MNLSRYITTQGVLLTDNTIIPIWDSRITFSTSEMYGNEINVKGERKRYFNLIDCIFDLVTKKVSMGVELVVYPDLTKLEHKVGTIVLFEDRQTNTLTKIIDIVYERFNLEIKKGKDIEEWELKKFDKDTIIDANILYAIKTWKPTYILENGKKTDYEMYLRKISNLDYLTK